MNQVSKIQIYIQSLRPENRKKKTTYDLNIWKRFCYSTGEKIERFGKHTSSRTEHSPCRFFMDVRKKDGGEYEPVSLTSVQRSIKRYLNDSGSNINILKDKEFVKSREVLFTRKRDLVANNTKVNRQQAA